MSIRIGIGTGLSAPQEVRDFWSWIEMCENGGIDSVWTSDRMIGPAAEPLAMLAAIAARTERMRLGTNVLAIPLREPVLLAKQIATIDVISNGRMLPCFGVGAATDPIWAATGVNSAARGARADEAITLVRLLLHEEAVSYRGEFFRYDGPGVQPRPHSPPPFWIGGDSAAAIHRTAALGDGWIGGLSTPAGAGETVARIKAALVQTSRAIDEDHYGVTLPFHIGKDDDPAVVAARTRFAARGKSGALQQGPGSFAVGPADHMIATLSAFVACGIEKFVAVPIADSPAALMEQTRLLISRIVPAMAANPVR